MAERDRAAALGGMAFSGIIVIEGIVVMIVWFFWLGLIMALVGAIAFGGYALGTRY